METYDIIFEANGFSYEQDFKLSLNEAMDYIEKTNGHDNIETASYEGGIIKVVGNDSGETVYETKVYTLTYDLYFDNDTSSDNEGFKNTLQEAMDYIERWNGTNDSYFEDYKGGTVRIVCNETEETVYEVDVF